MVTPTALLRIKRHDRLAEVVGAALENIRTFAGSSLCLPFAMHFRLMVIFGERCRFGEPYRKDASISMLMRRAIVRQIKTKDETVQPTETPFSTFIFAVASGDLVTAEAQLTDDIEWDLMPHNQILKGKDQVIPWLKAGAASEKKTGHPQQPRNQGVGRF